MKKMDLSERQIRNIENVLFGSELDFYDRYIADLPLEEQAKFMKEFPEFMSGNDTEDETDLMSETIPSANSILEAVLKKIK